MSPVLSLALLSTAFVATHLLMSHPPIRGPLVARLGLGGFRIAYSVVSVALYVPLAALWWRNLHAGAALWVLRGPVAVHGAELLAASGIALLVAGFLQPAPSSLESRVKGDVLEVRGMAHVTRHPVMAGTAMLCLAHVLVNGWVGDLWFMGSNLALAVLGALHQEQRMLATRPGYEAFARATTILPNPLGLARIGSRSAVAAIVGLGLAALLRYTHRWF